MQSLGLAELWCACTALAGCRLVGRAGGAARRLGKQVSARGKQKQEGWGFIYSFLVLLGTIVGLWAPSEACRVLLVAVGAVRPRWGWECFVQLQCQG